MLATLWYCIVLRAVNVMKLYNNMFSAFRGQRLAEQMQQQNPELVEQLRRQFQHPGGGPPPPGGNNPPRMFRIKFNNIAYSMTLIVRKYANS